MVEGGMKCVKYLLFIFNFIFWLSGIGVIAVGAIIQSRYSKFFNILGNGSSGYISVPVFIIVIGCIITIISFFGCCGSIKENYCMIITFAVLVTIVFLLEMAAGITAFVLRNDVETKLKEGLQNSMGKYNASDPDNPITRAWDYIQIDFDCCGLDKPESWDKFESDTYPTTCCKKLEDPCRKESPEFKDRGCWDKFREFVKKNISIIAGVGIGVGIIQIFGIVLACCLGSAIRKKYEIV